MIFGIPLNIPNILSLYRLLMFPVLLAFALFNKAEIFAILLVINLITDVLDGFIARTFNMQTEVGARLDSIADIGSYVLAVLGVFLFKWTDFEPYKYSFFAFLACFIGVYLLSLIKFGRFPSLHLYSTKSMGYVQGLFFLVLFAFTFNIVLYHLAIYGGIIAFAESIVIQLLLPKMRSNVKGLFWLLKEPINK